MPLLLEVGAVMAASSLIPSSLYDLSVIAAILTASGLCLAVGIYHLIRELVRLNHERKEHEAVKAMSDAEIDRLMALGFKEADKRKMLEDYK